MKRGNLFSGIPGELPEEWTEPLFEGGAGRLRVERIVSRGHASPPEFWYEQEQVEWVVLLSGEAILRFEPGAEEAPPRAAGGAAETLELRPGDWVEIPARRRHRVERTAPDGDTVWLAVHWEPLQGELLVCEEQEQAGPGRPSRGNGG